MLREVKIISELFKEDPDVVRGYLLIGTIKRTTTLEDLDLIEERIRKEEPLSSWLLTKVLDRREALYMKEVRAATTEEQLTKAFRRIPIRYTEASELAVCKMVKILDDKDREEVIKGARQNDPMRHQFKV